MTSLSAHVVVERTDGFDLQVDLSVRAGSTLAVLGPNGAGKTTLVEALAGLLPIHKGLITLADRVLDDAGDTFVTPENRQIGVVFQDHLLFPHMSVRDNLGFGLMSRGIAAGEIAQVVSRWLDDLELTELAERRPGELSGGEAQRVALGRALVIEPQLLLLDEPLAALDVTTRATLRRTLAAHLSNTPVPRLLITHDPAEAYLLADQIAVLEGGRITQQGTPDDIRLRPRTVYAADLAGLNLLPGRVTDGVVSIGSHDLHVADHHTSGEVLAAIHPRAIALYPDRPEGSPRNTWQTTIEDVEHLGERVRVQLGEPLRITAEITPGSVAALGLGQGVSIWVSIKATEIDVSER